MCGGCFSGLVAIEADAGAERIGDQREHVHHAAVAVGVGHGLHRRRARREHHVELAGGHLAGDGVAGGEVALRVVGGEASWSSPSRKPCSARPWITPRTPSSSTGVDACCTMATRARRGVSRPAPAARGPDSSSTADGRRDQEEPERQPLQRDPGGRHRGFQPCALRLGTPAPVPESWNCPTAGMYSHGSRTRAGELDHAVRSCCRAPRCSAGRLNS